MGRGKPLVEDLDLRALGDECVEFVGKENATHAVFQRTEDREGAGSDRRAIFFSKDQFPVSVSTPISSVGVNPNSIATR